MPTLSLILRLITLVVLITLGVIWFQNREEWNAISSERDALEGVHETSGQPLSATMRTAIEEYEEMGRQASAAEARAESLSRNVRELEGRVEETRNSLRGVRDELRAANEARREVESDLTSARRSLEGRERELNSTREDLIAARSESDRIRTVRDELREENRRLSLRIREMEDRSPAAVADNGDAAEMQENIAKLEEENDRLRQRLDVAQRQIQDLRGGANLASLMATPDFDPADLDAMGIRVLRVSRVSTRSNLVTFVPVTEDLIEPDTVLRLFQDGVEVARVRVREADSNFVAANILGTSFFPERLKQGGYVEFRRS